TSGAREAQGVVAAFSGADLAGEWAGPLPMAWPVTEDTKNPPHWPLTPDKARYAGDAVAVVVAETRALATDAAELVAVDYEPLPAVTGVEAALADGAPIVHDDLGSNHCYTWSLAAGDADRLFSKAAVTIEERYYQQRLVPNAIEPRGVLVQPSPAQGEFTMWSATQIPHIARVTLSGTTGIPEAKLRVIAPDVGGGFGSKLNVYAEEALCLILARKLGRPVKWTEERSEAYLATSHGRDVVQRIELAATQDGKITALRARLWPNMGAYLQIITPGTPLLGAWVYAGAYDIEGYDVEFTGVFTNTTPTDAYRGAGRPEATYLIERAVDALARKLDMDPIELRRKNFIKEFPKTIASGLTVDSGDYEASLDKALQMVGYDDFRREQSERRAAGGTKLLGIGFSTYMEMCGLAPSRILGAIRYGAGGWDGATIRCLPTGTVQALIGTSPHGQGHATTFSQIIADRLGVAYEDVEVLHGDTSLVPLGMDTYGSRSLAVGGVAVYNATEKIIEKAKKIAAHQLEAAEDDLEYANGAFTVAGTDRSVTVKEAALAAWTAHNLPDGLEPGLEATAVYDPPNFSWPAGTHVCIVEVDTETGAVDLQRYVAVDDVGTVINPQIVDGQVHGGIAQGIAQALFEEAVYDEDGNLMNGSMVGYMVPSAAELPSFELARTETPSPTNPMGVKGVGETGTIASTPAVINAVIDALAPLGVTDIDMPATPERVWRAIQEAAS
ncbi:MAG: xanthine dehydrogenase family protein molybdopterin-binding subunit, partial [Gaiellaceae bacterium]